MIPLSGKLAVRSLGRNLRRTLLSWVGIGVGCALAVLLTSFIRGASQIYATAAAEGGAGHLRVAPEGWLARRDPQLRLRNGEAALAAARALPGAALATPRTRTQALLAMGTHVVGVELTGVEPRTEPASNRFVRRVVKGRYLQPGEPGTIVLGKALAEQLDTDVDDELVATVVGAGGGMQSAMFRVVGLVTSGSRQLDAGIAQVQLQDVAQLTGLPGIGEIAILLKEPRQLERERAALAARLPPGDGVLTWAEVVPELSGHLRQDAGFYRLLTGILTFLVLLGVASAQLAAVLERRREFAVLSALGMKPLQMARQLMLEAVALGLSGAALALAMSAPLAWRLSVRGLDISRLRPTRELTFSGLTIEPRIYTDFGAWLVPYALSLALIATLLASIYPAWFVARMDPAAALRVAQ